MIGLVHHFVHPKFLCTFFVDGKAKYRLFLPNTLNKSPKEVELEFNPNIFHGFIDFRPTATPASSSTETTTWRSASQF